MRTRRRTYRPALTTLAVAAPALLVLAGCADQQPAEPSREAPAEESSMPALAPHFAPVPAANPRPAYDFETYYSGHAATPITSPADVGPAATVVDFTEAGLSPLTVVTTQYAALGVTFESNKWVQSPQEITFVPGSDPFWLGNFNFGSVTCRGPRSIHFSPPVGAVGFGGITNPNDRIRVEAKSEGVSLGSTEFDTNLGGYSFGGLKTLGTLDELVVEAVPDPRTSGSNRCVGIDNLTFGLTEITVEIDLKPGSDPNAVNPESRGTLSVAVLSTQTAAGGSVDFDAADADPSTVTLGDATVPDAPVVERRNGTLMASLEDVDEDGDRDLVVHVETQALVDNGDLNDDTEELVLSGETGDGTPIRGTDDVKIVGGGNP